MKRQKNKLDSQIFNQQFLQSSLELRAIHSKNPKASPVEILCLFLLQNQHKNQVTICTIRQTSSYWIKQSSGQSVLFIMETASFEDALIVFADYLLYTSANPKVFMSALHSPFDTGNIRSSKYYWQRLFAQIVMHPCPFVQASVLAS